MSEIKLKPPFRYEDDHLAVYDANNLVVCNIDLYWDELSDDGNRIGDKIATALNTAAADREKLEAFAGITSWARALSGLVQIILDKGYAPEIIDDELATCNKRLIESIALLDREFGGENE